MVEEVNCEELTFFPHSPRSLFVPVASIPPLYFYTSVDDPQLISIMPPMIVSLFGGGDAVAMLGMQMSSGLIASIAGPPLAGLITDHNTVILADGTKEIYWIPTIVSWHCAGGRE